MMKYLHTAFFSMILTTLLGCTNFGQTVKLGEQFTLKTNETATVKVANFEITVNQIGRKWLANGGGETLDFIFSVKHDRKIDRFASPLPEIIPIDDYKIEIVKTEPFGYGYAIFVVSKLTDEDKIKLKAEPKIDPKQDSKTDSNLDAAKKFVESFGWHIDESAAPVKVPIDFPNNFDGLPFNLYQSASQRSGVDMTSLIGEKVEMLKYMLKEKQTDRGTDFITYAHLIVENGKVVGAWRTDSSARAPGIYSFVRK